MFDLMDAVEQYSAAFVSAAANDHQNNNNNNTTSSSGCYFSVHFTGIHWFQRDLIQATRTDMLRMDLLVLPALLIVTDRSKNP